MNLLTARKPAAGESAADAVAALYAEHALGLTRFAQVMLGDRATAEDVVHDAFCGLYRRWAHLDDQARAQAYLRSAVLNGCRSAFRRAGRTPVFETLDTAETVPPGLLGHAPDAESALLAGQQRTVMLSALRRLPSRQREVLVLRYYLDLPDTEIASALGIAASTVRSTAYRGLSGLERLLGKELP